MMTGNLSIKLIINLLVLYHLLCYNFKAKVLAFEAAPHHQPCIGKHQIHLKEMDAFQKNITELIEFKWFDEIPSETFLERNDQLILINFIYNDTAPTIELDFESFLSVKGTFRFKCLYFQWFEKVADFLSYKNLTFPAELHAVFYDENAKSFDQAAATDKNLIVLAFNIEIDPLKSSNFIILREYFEQLQYSFNKIPIANQNLAYWLKADLTDFYVYEGSLIEFGCQAATVLWIDIIDCLIMPPDVINMFVNLMDSQMNPIMSYFHQTLNPKGKIFLNLPGSSFLTSILPVNERDIGIYNNGACRHLVVRFIGALVVLYLVYF